MAEASNKEKIFTKEFVQKKLLGQVIDDRYEVLSDGFLGEGGFGFVFKGKHRRLGVKIRNVAIKIIKSEIDDDPKTEQEIFHEAILQMIAQEEITDLQAREHITKVFDFGVWEVEAEEKKDVKRRMGYIIMELIKGSDLSKEIKLFKNGKIPENIATKYIVQVCRGLQALHQLPEPIIHRDIKPENIMLTPDKQAKLTDFGLAYRLNHAFDWAEGVAGTQVYMAPESLRGSGAGIPASDVFSLGVTWYQMITGRLPFDDELPPNGKEDAEANKWRYQRRERILPAPPRHFDSAIPERINDILLKCLKFEPKERYRNVGELLQDIERPDCEQLILNALDAFEKKKYKSVIKHTEAWLSEQCSTSVQNTEYELMANLSIACAQEKQYEKTIQYSKIAIDYYPAEKMKDEKAFEVTKSFGIALKKLGKTEEAANEFYKLRRDEEKKLYGIISKQQRIGLYEAELQLHELTENEAKARFLRRKLERLKAQN